MSDLFQRRFAQLGVSKLLSSQEDFSGVDLQTFRINNGSRILFFIDISAISLGATLNFTVANAADIGQEFLERVNENYTAVGQYPVHVMDIHKFFVVTTTVTGGSATYSIGSTLADNSTSEDAEALLVSIDAKLGAPLPLPTGAATEAKQDVGNASLASIDSKLIDFNTEPVQTIQLFTKPYDAITATYPSATQEVYETRIGGVAGVVQETATVNYTDSTKNFIQDVART